MAKIEIQIVIDKKNKEEGYLFSFLNLKKYFENSFFTVPIFQRKYSWDNKKIEELIEEFDDSLIKDLIEKPYLSFSSFPIEKNEDKTIKSLDLKKSKFFGTIYLSKNDKKDKSKTIIDGQQRIATWFIFILCCYKKLEVNKNFYLKNKDPAFGLFYEKMYFDLRKILFKTVEKKYLFFENLRFNTTQLEDKKVFQALFEIIFDEKIPGNNFEEIIENAKNFPDIKKLKKSTIFKNYQTFENNFLEKWIRKINNFENKENYKFFLDKKNEIFKTNEHITWIIVFWTIYRTIERYKFGLFEINKDQESIIFETINGKGLQLSILDIIKNKIYEGYEIDKENFKIDFNLLEEKITKNYNDLKNSDNFLLAYFKACYSNLMLDNKKNNFMINFISKKRLQANFQKIIISLKNEINPYVYFLKKTIKFIELYEKLFTKNEYKNNYFNVHVLVSSLNILKYESIKVILISLLIKSKENKIQNNEKEIFEYIEKLYKYYLLGLTIENKQANSFENDFKKIMYVNLKYGINSIISKNYDSLKSNHNDTIFNDCIKFNENMDKYFRNNKKEKKLNEIIDENRDYENEIIKWYLYNVLEIKYKENIKLEEIHLEHVLPRSSKEWEMQKHEEWFEEKNEKSKKEPLYEKYKLKIGNCMLLLRDFNWKIGNKTFDVKYNEIKKDLNEKKSSWLDKEKTIFEEYSFLTLAEKGKRWTPHVIKERNKIIKNILDKNNFFNFAD